MVIRLLSTVKSIKMVPLFCQILKKKSTMHQPQKHQHNKQQTYVKTQPLNFFICVC
jgi:hypothetical protein